MGSSKVAFQSLVEDLGKERGKSEEASGKKGEAIFTPGWGASAGEHRHRPDRCHPGRAKETGREIDRRDHSTSYRKPLTMHELNICSGGEACSDHGRRFIST